MKIYLKMIMVQPIVCSDIKYLGVNGTISSNGHYEYPDVPPASHLLSLLQNKIKLNDWEFYQAYKQGVYVFPKKTSFVSTFVNHPPLSAYYYEVKFEKGRSINEAYIVWHYLSNWLYGVRNGSDNYIENGIINSDNTWTSLGNGGTRDDSFYAIDQIGETFNYLGKKVGTYTIDNSKYPPVVIIPIEKEITTADLSNQGWVETIDSKTISGWAAKGKNPSAVDIYVDNVKYTVTPNLSRPDVASLLNPTNKKFGWTFDIPQTDGNAKEGQHNVKVYFANSQMALSSNLPLFYVVTPPPPSGGTGTGGTKTGGSGNEGTKTGSNLSNTKTDKTTTTPKQPNLKPILIGLGIVILGLVAYKILKKK